MGAGQAAAASVWDLLLERLRDSRTYGELRGRLGRVVGLPSPAASWVVSLLCRDLERPGLVVVPTEGDARAWVESALLVAGPDRGEETVYFPTPALTPYQEVEASLQVRAEEARAVDRILHARRPIVVCTPRALFQPLPQPAQFADAVTELATGDEIPLNALAARLLEVGYHRADLVTETGVFAVRGGVFDFYPPAESAPLRLDLFGDTIESIRHFDPISQRSQGARDRIRVLPLTLARQGFEQAVALGERLAELLADEEPGSEALQRIDTLERGETFPGWENYLTALFGGTHLADLLPGALVTVVDPARLESEITHHDELVAHEFHNRQAAGRLALPPERLLAGVDDVLALVAKAELRLGDAPGTGTAALDFRASLTDLFHHQLPRFPRELETARERGERLLLVAPAEHHDRLGDLLAGRELETGPGHVELVAGELERGFRLPDAAVVLFGEAQLFPRRASQASPRRPFFSGLRDLRVGDYVVHEDHGIGQFVATRLLSGGGGPDEGTPPALAGLADETSADVEVMEILYSKGQTLLLPLDRLHQIQKYSGLEGLGPRLDRLGGSSWNKTKTRVRRGLRKLATDLLKLYAERQLAKAPPIGPDSDSLAEFEAAFEYEETRDQLEAIAAIKQDLEQGQPMDRLLCGDVGFGKTEVAMRAAYKVVDSGYQVAVLAPTTILADQHLETFRRRFDGFPVVVEMISRFRTPAEIRGIRERLAQGKVDILVGTHRLLSQDVQFPSLGLLVCDEEQRFGVAQKERLKELRKNVHVLAMSATPVPRTLQLSLAGVRDMSVIESPPKDRMAVETRILPMSDELVREAIEFELERSGQVYYVYNRVESIEAMVRALREMAPQARITVGHGQMDERELARRMHAFTRGEYDVLVATTIIENGIDIPNVNTMIIHRADRFGLAQLYQLRGRVGRSNQLAYCYFLVPQDRVLSEDARKRLEALREFTELGAGFRIAARDLEIRGAGNMMGAEQSGHIAELGIETYMKMLEDTVRELRGEETEAPPSATIDLPVTMSIPSDYIGDTNLRMEIYRRLGAGEEPAAEVLAELRDRFGPPPENVETLVKVARLKHLAEELRVQSISARRGKLSLRLRRDARIDPEALIRFVSDRPGASFSPSGVLTLGDVAPADALAVARHTLEVMAQSRRPLDVSPPQ